MRPILWMARRPRHLRPINHCATTALRVRDAQIESRSLARAPDYESGGHEFESLRARQISSCILKAHSRCRLAGTKIATTSPPDERDRTRRFPVAHRVRLDRSRRAVQSEFLLFPPKRGFGFVAKPFVVRIARSVFGPPTPFGENPPYGMIGRIEETSASFEARSAPRSYPTPILKIV
jgi:hypothetical protein